MKFVFKKYLRNTAPEKERDQHEIQSQPRQGKATNVAASFWKQQKISPPAS